MFSGMTIEYLRRQILEGKYSVAFTHTEKLRRRKIGLDTIEQVVASGKIIESYPDDPRRVLIITAYEPDPDEWEPDWKTRKRGGTP